MIKVIKNYYGVKTEHALSDLITKALDGNSPDAGAVEAARWTAENATTAIGEMAVLLVEKGVLTLEEALRLGGLDHRDIKVKE